MEQHWIVTGVSTGLGKAIAKEAGSRGHRVTGTVRQAEQISEFENLFPGRFHAVVADVRYGDQLDRLVAEAMAKGRPDVLVNNAGYGLVGAVEEISEEEYRHQMEVNFFGALALTQRILPVFRQNRRGHIFNISSIAGLNGSAGLALYNASKFALEGLSEGLMLETRNLGIQVTLVEPGPFRTHWAGKGLVHSRREIADYGPVIQLVRDRLAQVDGNQAGDPERAARLICDVALQPGAPLRLLLGKAGYSVVEAKIRRMSEELSAWKEKGIATDFD